MSSARKRQRAGRVATMIDHANQQKMLAKHHAAVMGAMAEEAARRHDAMAADWRERNAAWWALVMGAAAALEDAAHCLQDPDAKRAAEGAAKHYRSEAQALWPNVLADRREPIGEASSPKGDGRAAG